MFEQSAGVIGCVPPVGTIEDVFSTLRAHDAVVEVFPPVPLQTMSRGVIERTQQSFSSTARIELASTDGETYACGDESVLRRILICILHNVLSVSTHITKHIKVTIHSIRRQTDEELVPGSVSHGPHVGITVSVCARDLSSEAFRYLLSRCLPHQCHRSMRHAKNPGFFTSRFEGKRHGVACVAQERNGEGFRFILYLQSFTL